MGRTPMVSVVLNVYNGAAYLRDCMESVLAQTFSDWELIVVDDASTDTTPEILASFQDPRIHVYRNCARHHICFTCNVALSHSIGQWIAHIDHDDLWAPDKLEKQIAYVTAHPEVGACFTFADIIGSDGKTIEGPPQIWRYFHTTFPDQRSWARHLFYEGNALCHSSSLVRRDLMGGYNLFLRQLHDYDLWCQLVGKTQFYVLPEELVHYRWEERPEKGSASTPDNMMRTYNEYVIAKERLLSRLTDEQLVAWFGSDFRCPDAAAPLELQIERAFLLCGCGQTDSPVTATGLEALERVIRQPGALEVLEQRYHFTLFQLYDMTAQRAYYQPVLMEWLRSGADAKARSRALAEQLRQSEAQVRELEQQISCGQDRIRELEDQLCQAGDHVRNVEEQLRQAGDHIQNVEGQLRQAGDYIQDVEGQLRQAGDYIKQIEERCRQAEHQLEQQQSTCAALEQERDRYRAELERVTSSASWKMTAPFRAIKPGRKK